MGLFSKIQDAARREAQQALLRPEPAVSPPEPEESKDPTPAPETPEQESPPPPVKTQMDDGEAVAASLKRIRTDTERLTRRNMKECVAEHLAELCAKDAAFARAVIQPKKSMANCFRYINRKAKEYVEQERRDSDITEGGVYGCDVPDDLCYGWAVDYFNDPEADKEPAKQPAKKAAAVGTAKPKSEAAKPVPKPAPTSADAGFEQISLMGAAV